jgi:hypothetical protein
VRRASPALLAGAAILVVLAVGAGARRLAGPRAAGDPMILFTQVPASDTGWDGGAEDAQRFPDRSRIVALDGGGNNGGVRVLTAAFRSARAPMVSPDGKRMVFSGQRRADDPWQIWEMRLDNGRTRPLTAEPGWYTDPAYLADGHVVLSGRDEPAAGGFALYTTGGADLTRITFGPGRDLESQVLEDGQVLFVSGTRYFVERQDGTGLRLFYQSGERSRPGGRAWETDDGRILFVERGDSRSATGGRGRLMALSESRPLQSRVELSDRVTGSFRSVYPLASGKLLVSYRPAGGSTYSLYEFDPAGQRLGPVVASDPAYHAVEPVVATARPSPKTFYSVVDAAVKTGELYCLDANQSSLPPAAAARGSLATRLRVLGSDGLLGEVPLAADGSFLLDLPADVPLRFETVDGRGRLVRGPSAWLWVRPNEKRGCVGCHEKPDLAPEDRVPDALNAAPVSVPRASSQRAGGSRP